MPARQIPPTADDRTFRHKIIQGEVQDENAFVLDGVAGHAGLFSTAEDLTRFAHAMLSMEDDPILRPETVALFTRASRTRRHVPRPGLGYALCPVAVRKIFRAEAPSGISATPARRCGSIRPPTLDHVIDESHLARLRESGDQASRARNFTTRWSKR